MLKILIFIFLTSCQSSAKKMPDSKGKIFNPKNNELKNEFIIKVKDKYVKNENDLSLDFKYVAPLESVSKIRNNFYLIKFKDDSEVSIKDLKNFNDKFKINYIENIEPNYKVTLY